MEIILKRTARRKNYTLGRLEIDGKKFCDTLEPTWRDIGWGRPGRKVKGRTAIPEGRYPVVITWSERQEQWLPLLLHVPQFDGVRIAAGNTEADTQGDILVGIHVRQGLVYDSRLWLYRLKREIVAAKNRGEGVWIKIC